MGSPIQVEPRHCVVHRPGGPRHRPWQCDPLHWRDQRHGAHIPGGQTVRRWYCVRLWPCHVADVRICRAMQFGQSVHYVLSGIQKGVHAYAKPACGRRWRRQAKNAACLQYGLFRDWVPVGADRTSELRAGGVELAFADAVGGTGNGNSNGYAVY